VKPEIIYEDGEMVVINKPAGMVVNDSKTSGTETVQAWFAAEYLGNSDQGGTEFGQKGGVVHRLDKETSGVLVLARNAGAYERLKQQFLERETKKQYWALVHGIMKEKTGILSKPIVRNPKSWGKFTVGEELSRTAVTEWRVKDEFSQPDKVSEVDLLPLTGRTHQLRVHLQFLGHPIVGDNLYLGKRRLEADRGWCPRMCLHASRLEIKHPTDNRTMEFTAVLPADLEEIRAKLVH